MNLPNKLTVSRFGLTAVFLWAMFSKFTFNDTLALIFFCLAGITDFLDGRIARSRNLITNFGKLMDPLADKVMVCSAFIAFVESTHMNLNAPVKVGAWMVVIIVGRELAITGLRLLAASKNIVLAAERYDGSDPVNLGSGTEIAIRDLAIEIAAAVGFQGRVLWDATKPNGQPRRSLDTSRAAERFGFRAETRFSDGLRATVDWYRQQGT